MADSFLGLLPRVKITVILKGMQDSAGTCRHRILIIRHVHPVSRSAPQREQSKKGEGGGTVVLEVRARLLYTTKCWGCQGVLCFYRRYCLLEFVKSRYLKPC